MREREGPLVFGLATQGQATTDLEKLLRWIADRAGTRLRHEAATSYELLAEKMGNGEVGVAWLPPLVFVRLEGAGLIAPLVTNLRAGRSTYQSVLVVHADSPIRAVEELHGT